MYCATLTMKMIRRNIKTPLLWMLTSQHVTLLHYDSECQIIISKSCATVCTYAFKVSDDITMSQSKILNNIIKCGSVEFVYTIQIHTQALIHISNIYPISQYNHLHSTFLSNIQNRPAEINLNIIKWRILNAQNCCTGYLLKQLFSQQFFIPKLITSKITTVTSLHVSL